MNINISHPISVLLIYSHVFHVFSSFSFTQEQAGTFILGFFQTTSGFSLVGGGPHQPKYFILSCDCDY